MPTIPLIRIGTSARRRLDQLLAEQLVDELLEVGAQSRRLNLVLAEQLFVRRLYRAGAAERIPHARAHGVQTEVRARYSD